MLKFNPTARALLVFGAVVALSTGVTMAVFNDRVVLAGNRMTSATAELKIKTERSWRWSNEAEGFHIRNLVPGTGETRTVYFKNAGKVPLNLTVRVPHWPDRPHGGYGFQGWENVTLSITGHCGETVQTDMEELLRRTPVDLPCGPLPVGAAGDPEATNHVGNYDLHFDINPEAIHGDRAKVGDFDLRFTGTQDY